MLLLQIQQSFSVNTIQGQWALLRHTAVQMMAFKMYFKLTVKGKKEHMFGGTTLTRSSIIINSVFIACI